MATLQPGEKARMYALGKIARGGATRGGYVDSRVYLSHGGQQVGWGRTDPAVGTIIDSLQVTDVLDEQPNSCRYRVNGAVPSNGDEVLLTMGSKNSLKRLFAGHALTVQQLYAADNPQNVQADVAAVDYTWLLGNLLITKAYRNQSATDIARDLVAFAAGDGFTSGGVAANLPPLDELTYTNEPLPEALTRLARRIGAYWYCDYHKVVHLFFTEPQRPDPEPLIPAHRSLAHFTRDQDRTQTLTRVYVEGRGSTVLGAVGVGDTKIPLGAVDMFTVASDVFLKVSQQGAEGGAQHLSFSGVVAGGKGALVGPGIGPSAAPTLALQSGGSVEAGTHGYAVTFATAAGESLVSSVAMITAGPVGNPLTAPTATFFQTASANGNFMNIGDTVTFTYAYSMGTYAQQTLSAPVSASYVLPSNNDPFNPTMVAGIRMDVPYSTDPRITQIFFYIKGGGTGNAWALFTQTANNPAGGTCLYGIMGAGYGSTSYGLPGSNATASNTVLLSAIPVGSTAVTGRKIYRTAANQAQLKLLTTIANNTATTHTDTAADATLGANVPTSDTSGLQQPPGQVLPGTTTLPVAGTGGFETAGGWASIGNGEQEIRYTALTAGSLTGIPATGIGSISAAIAYNSTVTASPMLTGIPATGTRSIRTALTRGDEIYLVVQIDNTQRQSDLAADVGGPGIREEWVQDRRLSIPEARARGQATLATRPLDQERVRYTCRDLRTAAGTTITVNLPAPTNVTGTYKVQQVTIANFRPQPTQYPTYTVEASSSRFSFEDWLRVMRTKE
jgi:hypothetical protein